MCACVYSLVPSGHCEEAILLAWESKESFPSIPPPLPRPPMTFELSLFLQASLIHETPSSLSFNVTTICCTFISRYYIVLCGFCSCVLIFSAFPQPSKSNFCLVYDSCIFFYRCNFYVGHKTVQFCDLPDPGPWLVWIFYPLLLAARHCCPASDIGKFELGTFYCYYEHNYWFWCSHNNIIDTGHIIPKVSDLSWSCSFPK